MFCIAFLCLVVFSGVLRAHFARTNVVNKIFENGAVLLCIAVYLCLLGVLRAGTDTHDVLCCCVRCLCLFVSWYRDIKSFAAVCCVCVYCELYRHRGD